MSELVSIQKAAARCKTLIGTKDINSWTDGFLQSVCSKVEAGYNLSDKQEAKLLEIYAKHFANAPSEEADIPLADKIASMDDLDKMFAAAPYMEEDEIILHSDKYDRS